MPSVSSVADTQYEFEDEYTLFSITVGATGAVTLLMLTVLVMAFMAFTPAMVREAGTLAIVVSNYLWVVVSVLLCGISMLLLASAAGIYQEQAKHKDLFEQTIHHLNFMHNEKPNKKLLEALKNAQHGLAKEKEAPHACGVPIKPDAFRILVGYTVVAVTAVTYRLIASQFEF